MLYILTRVWVLRTPFFLGIKPSTSIELVLSGIRARSLAILQGSNNYVGKCVDNLVDK